ncbi:MAG: M4 family metallopeptidase [Candidatus Obscuribacterales bacterium]|nr:M4 family metallopeptidase [Candidatus Obscuribacterales bacterium]
MDTPMQKKHEDAQKEGENLQNTKSLINQIQDLETAFQKDGLIKFTAAAKFQAAAAQGQDNVSGVIPPYMLEELAKRNPNVPGFQETLEKTILEPRFWPFPSKDYKGAREVYDAKGEESQPGEKARFEGDKATGNSEIDNAYDFTGQVRSFYKEVLGRNSIDGKGMKFISTVNYGENYENAFWNGKQMTYGKPSANSPFKTFVLLDVCGHEITHGVTEKESHLKYYGQAGALNESLSDIFGELIQQRANKTQAKDADWVVGDGIWKDGIKGRGLRDMLHPGTAYDDPKIGKDPQPAHMKDYIKTTRDKGGVHLNSGIPNRAFALFASSVGGYAWEEPGKIWYAARAQAGSNPSFAQFAYQTIEQAKKLGFEKDVDKLKKAWDEVGVKPSASETDTSTPVKSEEPRSQNGWTPMYNEQINTKKSKPAA